MAVETVLRKMRQDLSLKLEDVAEAASISVPGYYQIEIGQRTAPARVAQAIADRIGMPIDALFLPANFAVRKI